MKFKLGDQFKPTNVKRSKIKKRRRSRIVFKLAAAAAAAVAAAVAAVAAAQLDVIRDSDKTFVLEALRPSYLSPFVKENDQANLLKPIRATFIESLGEPFITFLNSTRRSHHLLSDF
ncbi:hypothetical protein HZH68_003415 [Vespula germanica]|uniref:Uncharacterized protein n=1 Tax=Vespula germanica TaxID=30212 RepID=A0A834U369_VESGE|nr:hypothetical protein HZH68_003415 [Vespula germanica]